MAFSVVLYDYIVLKFQRMSSSVSYHDTEAWSTLYMSHSVFERLNPK